MSDHAINLDRLFDLMGVVCDEDASQDEITELETLAIADRGACRRYLGYCRMHSTLRLALRAHRATQEVHQQIDIRVNRSSAKRFRCCEGPRPPFPLPPPSSPPPSTAPSAFLLGLAAGVPGRNRDFRDRAAGRLRRACVPARSRSPGNRQCPAGRLLSRRWNLSGRITGMVDCKWAGSSVRTLAVRSFLGRKFALASGLMEITYDTGAKVILQGPVTYEVNRGTADIWRLEVDGQGGG